MKVKKWVDFGKLVQLEIGIHDIRAALAECFEVVTRDRLGESGPNKDEVICALSGIGSFSWAVTDEQIAMLNDAQRKTIYAFLCEQSLRFTVGSGSRSPGKDVR